MVRLELARPSIRAGVGDSRPRRCMIIENQNDVTTAVLSEVQLTEEEFQAAVGYIVALGKHTNDTHNEAVLMSGSLGFSTLICLLNNGDNGQTETSQNLLGPFWRMHSPATANGGSIVRSPTPGPALLVNAWFKDNKGNPVAGAEVDVWQSS